MLRRLPTPISITPDDISTLEDQLTRRLAYIHYKRTGEDPQGFFTTNNNNDTASAGGGKRKENIAGEAEELQKPIDPNDELKPLPGDKGRMGMSGRERIMGTVPGGRGR